MFHNVLWTRGRQFVCFVLIKAVSTLIIQKHLSKPRLNDFLAICCVNYNEKMICDINYNEKMNSSEEEVIKFAPVFFVEIKNWSFVYYIVVSTITLLANVLLIFAMLKDPLKCFLNATSYFIFHLAISDLLISLVFMEESLLWLTKFGGINGQVYLGRLGF